MGKTKGKIVKSGDTGCLTVKQPDGKVIQYDYNQPCSVELGIVENAVVTCTLVPSGAATIAVAVAPIDRGEIKTIDYVSGSGTIYEQESGTSYPFTQNYLKESGFAAGDIVKYTIVRFKDANFATCLVKPLN